jgi:hypothetical protein
MSDLAFDHWAFIVVPEADPPPAEKLGIGNWILVRMIYEKYKIYNPFRPSYRKLSFRFLDIHNDRSNYVRGAVCHVCGAPKQYLWWAIRPTNN